MSRRVHDRRGAHSGIRPVRDYKRLHNHIAAWADGEIPYLVVVGPAGTGKSSAYRSVMGDRQYHLFCGRQSPLYVYNTLHDNPDWPVILDDVSALLKDDAFRDLLRTITGPEPRVVHWGTTTAKLAGRPTSFTCTCSVLIVLNKLPARDPDLEAILDRCDAIYFDPTKHEIIGRMIALWPADRDLIRILAAAPLAVSLRTLDRARRWKRSTHLDMRQELAAECGVAGPVAKLAEIMASHPESDWAALYGQQTKLCERSYRRHKLIAERYFLCRESHNGCPPVRPDAERDAGAPDAAPDDEAPRTDGP